VDKSMKYMHSKRLFIYLICLIFLCSYITNRKSRYSLFSPEFEFKFNSVELVDSVQYWDHTVISDSVYGSIKSILVDNPNISMMEITGYADKNEKTPQKLSEGRANKIKSELVKRGIAAGRLTAIGKGVVQLVSESLILAEKDLKKRERMRQKNRRVNFRVTKFAEGVQGKEDAKED
jgi:hypothetical protein